MWRYRELRCHLSAKSYVEIYASEETVETLKINVHAPVNVKAETPFKL